MISTKQTKKVNYFLSQPHQPFFILGVINAMVFMLIFMLAYKGVVNLKMAVPLFHSYSLIFLVFSNFFIGFLFTTFPRFNQSETVAKVFYVRLFYASVISSILFLISVLTSDIFVILAMLYNLFVYGFVVSQLQMIYKKGHLVNKQDSFWILNALHFGSFGQILFLAVALGVGVGTFAVDVSFYLYLIFLTFSVAQRMIPFFSHSMEPKDSRFVAFVFFLFVLKVTFSFFENFYLAKILEASLDALIGVYMLREFLRWKLIKSNTPAILWVLHLGLFWLPAAFILSSVSLFVGFIYGLDFYFLGIHLVALGFLTTVFIGFGTRVVLGHSGLSPHADNFAKYLFLFVQFILILRALFSLNVALNWGMGFIFDISISAWLVLFLLWGYRYGKILIWGNLVR